METFHDMSEERAPDQNHRRSERAHVHKSGVVGDGLPSSGFASGVLIGLLRAHPAAVVAAMLAHVFASMAMLIMPLSVGYIVDTLASSERLPEVNKYLEGFLIGSLLFAIFAATRFFLSSWLFEQAVADIRSRAFRLTLSMEPGFFEGSRTGDILSRLNTDTSMIQLVLGPAVSMAMRCLLNLMGGVSLLLITSPRLTLVAVALVPVVSLVTVKVGNRVRNLAREVQAHVAESSAVAVEAFHGIQEIQAFGLQRRVAARYESALRLSVRTGIRRSVFQVALTLVAVVLISATVALIVWFGSEAVVDGEMTIGSLSRFVLCTWFVMSAAGGLVEVAGEFQRVSGATRSLADFLRTLPSIRDPESPVPVPTAPSLEVQFDNVTFAYPTRPAVNALQDVSVKIRAGETVAIVGPSGSGKSTVLRLILRFDDPLSGTVRLGGQDIRSMSLEELRSRVAIVPQDVILFATSIRENIRYGRQDASDDEVYAAAQAAAIHDVIRSLPAGYETVLGERGSRISGGQRQRLGIARALLRNPAVLLLDEATSSLDSANERLVQDALQPLMRMRTTIVIAHRLSTIQSADQILLLRRGRIADLGSHSELMERSSEYRELLVSQNQSAA